MDTAFLIAAVGLPLIGALHRFAVEYGYRGASWHEAWEDAWRVGMTLALISGLIVAANRLAG